MVEQQLNDLLLLRATVIKYDSFRERRPANKISMVDIDIGTQQQLTHDLNMAFSQAGVIPTPPKRLRQLRSGLAGNTVRNSVKSFVRQLIRKGLKQV